MQDTNSITIRYDRFRSTTRYEVLNFNNFNFARGLKSIDSKEDFFINKALSETEDVYDEVLNMYLMSLDKDYSFLDDFLGDELLPDYKAERLLKIIKKTQRIKYSMNDLKYIFKLINKNNKSLHFFIRNSNNNLSILLIDLYHMGIYGDNIVNGKSRTIPMNKIYKRHKDNMVMLDEIKKLTL